MMANEEYVVLKVTDSEPGHTTYSLQVATIQDYENWDQAATFNVGSHPDADARVRPYRVIVIPAKHWHEFEVFSESVRGHRTFAAYPSEHPTIKRPNGD